MVKKFFADLREQMLDIKHFARKPFRLAAAGGAAGIALAAEFSAHDFLHAALEATNYAGALVLLVYAGAIYWLCKRYERVLDLLV